jgi:hypothetical protein
MKPLSTRPFVGPFPTLPAGFLPRQAVFARKLPRRGPWERFSGGRWYPNTPPNGPFGLQEAGPRTPRLDCYALFLAARRILLTEKSHYAIQ